MSEGIDFPEPKTAPLTSAELELLREDDGRVALDDLNSIPKRNGAAPVNKPQGHTPRLIDLRTVKPRNVDWLIRDRLPLGMLSLMVGHGGVGKGVCWVNWAARASRGELGERRFVLISAPEDVYDTMLVPRLLAAKADLEYVRGIDMLVFPDDEAWLEEAMVDRDACLLVVDPVLTHLSAKTDSYRDHDVKLRLTPLLQIGARTRCAVLGVVHFTKSTERGVPVDPGLRSIWQYGPPCSRHDRRSERRGRAGPVGRQDEHHRPAVVANAGADGADRRTQ
jgi:hypothetical protein